MVSCVLILDEEFFKNIFTGTRLHMLYECLVIYVHKTCQRK